MKLSDSLTQKKIEFIPIEKNKVKLYVCGITPYDTTHIGHAFTYLFFDALVRFLKYLGYKVEYTQNVTDIDDDLLKRAKEVGQNWRELGEFWTERFLQDMQNLNVLKPTHFVKATDSIDKIIEIIKVLVKKKYAYEREGNVYFETKKFPKYGQLSHFTRDEMIKISKERGANPKDPLKKDPLDFILWQRSKRGGPFWVSPWGNGRPGWHIECTAMIIQYLGEQIDIHGGGLDLVFPHHESEIAQSESYSGKSPFVKFWLHTAMVEYQGEKMSKSLKNLVLVSDLLKNFTANSIRYALLRHHYRESWEFYESDLPNVNKRLKNIKKALNIPSFGKRRLNSKNYQEAFDRYMRDDINTPKALEMFEALSKTIIKRSPEYDVSSLQKALQQQLRVLGFQFKKQRELIV